jgi:hypothetical protein
LITPAKTTDPNPYPATAAPTNPPTRVCDELDGKPIHHVIRFQMIAAVTAAAINSRVIISGFITPLPMVLATFRGKTKNATKLKVAASPTAAMGDRTFVETTVAIEFAESWNPLIKSNKRTSAIKT